jgi:O-antigen/teichoic acid export membrane protein
MPLGPEAPPIDPSPPRLSPRLLADLATGYAATAARIGWWATITAVAFRRLSAPYFAALVVTRSAVTVLNYFAAGLGPATVHALAHQTRAAIAAIPLNAPPASSPSTAPAGEGWGEGPTLNYRNAAADEKPEVDRTPSTFAVTCGIALLGALIILAIGVAASLAAPVLLGIGSELPITGAYEVLVFLFALAAAARLLSEPMGAVLQSRKRIHVDNLLQLIADSLTGCLAVIWMCTNSGHVESVAAAALLGAVVLTVLRVVTLPAPIRRTELSGLLLQPWPGAGTILRFACLIALAQLADYLYAPTDYLLINHLLTSAAAVAYTPAVQIDSGLLLLVSAVGVALLPRAAAAHAIRDFRSLRRMYLQSTFLCLALMIAAVAVVLLTAKPLLSIWYGQDMPATRAILPLVLLNTIIGGSSAPARALLLAMGRARAFTTAALLAGLANVIASFIFVHFFHLGLPGIVLGTLLAVIARCGIWMPWYMLRSIRQNESPVAAASPAASWPQ